MPSSAGCGEHLSRAARARSPTRSRGSVDLPPLLLYSLPLQNVRVSSGDRITALPFPLPPSDFQAVLATAELGFVSTKAVRGPDVELDAQDLISHLTSRFAGQVLTSGQDVTFEHQVRGGAQRGQGMRAQWLEQRRAAAHVSPCSHGTPHPTNHPQGTNYLLHVNSLMVLDAAAEQQSVRQGQLTAETAWVFETHHGGGLTITGQRAVVATQVRAAHALSGGERAGLRMGRLACSPSPHSTAPGPPLLLVLCPRCAALQAQGVQL